MRFHSFNRKIDITEIPESLNNPFDYQPHDLCREAFGLTQCFIEANETLHNELSQGKMIGILVVSNPESGDLGFLASYSGTLDLDRSAIDYFVPPIYDILIDGGHYKHQERIISQISNRIKTLETSQITYELQQSLTQLTQQSTTHISEYKAQIKESKRERDKLRNESNNSLDSTQELALIHESQHQKAQLKRLERHYSDQISQIKKSLSDQSAQLEDLRSERKKLSAELQEWIFRQYRIARHDGHTMDLIDIFSNTAISTPPAASGDCAAPKLLQYAFLNNLKPIAIAEFWWGASPKSEIRHHGHHYGACKGKCEPILNYMLSGLDLSSSESHRFSRIPASIFTQDLDLDIVYQDSALMVINKPSGLLSVPGRDHNDISLLDILRHQFPNTPRLMMVNRLDMDTSGLVVAATNLESYIALQRQFTNHTARKRYVALIDTANHEHNSNLTQLSGTIELPLRANYLDRPRQIVDPTDGKYAKTTYKIIAKQDQHIHRIWLWPHTGRTHQLRIHCAHQLGLNAPILGDRLYGSSPANCRMYLHSEELTITHPFTDKVLNLYAKADF